jgi:hypothetical protein
VRVQFWVIAIGWVSSAEGSCVAQKRFTDCLCGYCCAPYVVARYQEGKEDWAKCIGYSCLRFLFGGLCDPLWADPKPTDGGFCAVYGHWSALPGPVFTEANSDFVPQVPLLLVLLLQPRRSRETQIRIPPPKLHVARLQGVVRRGSLQLGIAVVYSLGSTASCSLVLNIQLLHSSRSIAHRARIVYSCCTVQGLLPAVPSDPSSGASASSTAVQA